MLHSKTKWELEEEQESDYMMLQEKLNLSSITAKLLWRRGFRSVDEAKEFLEADIENIHDPFLMDGMLQATERIDKAIKDGEKILIFGDYDADGVSSTTIMIMLLKELGADFGWYIPNRFTEGYGPNIPALEKAKEEGASLVITVDTGIAAVSEIQAANDIGLDVIITDHHEPPPELPEAFCILNPKKPGCDYPFKELAGSGVAFKLAHALLGYFPKQMLDIFTIGTVSDLVPLLDENRVLVTRGLKEISVSEKPGIKALKRICRIEDEVEEDHIGFSMGPRINAAGRMDSADPAVHLLTSHDLEEADNWALVIDNLNIERKKLVHEMTEQAMEEVEKNFPPDKNKVIVVGKEGWNPGVIGIVASRLTDTFYRPAIVLAIDEESGEAKGSARSIEGFDMYQQLSKNRELLPHFGGHPMAAGLTMNRHDIDKLRERMCRQAEEDMEESTLIPSTKVDLSLSLKEVTLSALDELRKLAPFGIGHPKPVFLIKDVHLASKRKIGSEKNHLKLEFVSGPSHLDAIGFHLGHLADQLTDHVSMSAVGELSINEWNGFRKPQLFLQDMAVKEWQLFDKRQNKNVEEYLIQLPDEDTTVVVFRETTYTKLAPVKGRKQVITGPQDIRAGSILATKDLVLLDMPFSMDELSSILSHVQGVERVHAFLKNDEEQLFFQPSPSRQDFKWYFAFLKSRKTFEFEKYGEELARRKGWPLSVVSFMTEVFFELDFVKMSNGLVTVNDNPVKKDLARSILYRRHFQKKKAEQDLLYSTSKELKDTLAPYLSKSDPKNEMKEKVGNGF